MEDLRTKSQIKKEEGIGFKSNNTIFVKLFLLKYYKHILYILIILLLMLFPYEIGNFIGNWIYNFIKGLTYKF